MTQIVRIVCVVPTCWNLEPQARRTRRQIRRLYEKHMPGCLLKMEADGAAKRKSLNTLNQVLFSNKCIFITTCDSSLGPHVIPFRIQMSEEARQKIKHDVRRHKMFFGVQQ